MDGDDAVEFFEKFGKKFHVDLTALQDHWHDHFCSEGLWGRGSSAMVVSINAQDLAYAAAAGKWVKCCRGPREDLFPTFG